MTLHLDRLDGMGERIARAAFPAYHGRTFKVRQASGPMSVVSYWDGGSRDYYALVRLVDMAVLPVPQNGTMFDGGPLPGVEIPSGCVIVEHSIFCGKDMGLTFHVRADEALGLLPPAADVEPDVLTVLRYSASHKNTYGGETNIRFREARGETGISAECWETAKASAIASKYLNAAGAITTAGRNILEARRMKP